MTSILRKFRVSTTRLTRAACAAAVVVAASTDARTAPNGFHPEFDGARLLDLLHGSLPDADPLAHVRFRALAGSRLSLTLAPEAGVEAPAAATGLTLVLRNGAGADLGVAGGPNDVSKGDGTIRWKNVALTAPDTYALDVAGTGAGGWKMTLQGKVPSSQKTTVKAPDLPPDGVAQAPFEGLAQANLDFKLQADGSKSRFEGEVLRIVQPDGSDLPGVPESAKKGKVRLLQDGVHTLEYRNSASALGDAKAVVTVKPALRKRVVHVRANVDGGSALVPKVKKISPPEGFHKEDAFEATVTGTDFQPGCDVRLTRKNRPDILGVAVEFRSETEVACRFDLDTADTTGDDSIGTWTVGLWNAPVYTVPDDPTTLVKDSPTKHESVAFPSVKSSSIRLPKGVLKETEVWHVKFNADFQDDLNAMGLGSEDLDVRSLAREAVEAYTILFLRDLFRCNETSGKVSGKSVPVSFVVDPPPSVAGDAGEDYNRIEVGGRQQAGDPTDPDALIAWGYTPLDPGNAQRDDLSIDVDDSMGGTTRAGLGVRTRVLDPTLPTAANSWVAATLPLRNRPLTAFDLRYFTVSPQIQSKAHADRYRDIVEQTTRAAREIAAIVAHHVAKAMGRDDGGAGPLANPALSGGMWPTTGALFFADSDVFAMQSAAVPHQLPGKSDKLTVGYFPLRTTEILLPDLVTDTNYVASFALVGGRPNATLDDYRASYASGSDVIRNLTLSPSGLVGKSPTMLTQNVVNCGIAFLRIAIQDRKTDRTTLFLWRVKVLPDLDRVPVALRPSAENCRNQVLATP